MKRIALALLVFASALAAEATTDVSPALISTRGGTQVSIRTDQPFICGSPCPELAVFFDGVQATDLHFVTPNQITVIAPPHPTEAIVPIDIRYNGFTMTRIEQQLAYVLDRESVLVPLSIDGLPGKDGTIWSTELWVHNASDKDITLLSPICLVIFFGVSDCGRDPLPVQAGTSRRVPNRGYGTWFPQTYFYIPTDQAPAISFDLRLFNSAGRKNGAGTALPVVRESNFRHGKTTLLNVPGNNTSVRKQLRIYFGGNAEFAIRAYDLESGRQLGARSLVIDNPIPTDSGPGPLPSYASNVDLFDVPEVAHAEHLRIEIEPVSPANLAYWAFLSVTDNETQQVTTIVPQ